MAELIEHWAGRDRIFRLNTGAILDVEEALNKCAIGEIFLRVTTGKFYIKDIIEIMRAGLICGGETSIEAKRLLDNHFDKYSLSENAAIAGDLLCAVMVGIEADDTESSDGDIEAYKFSEISQICRVVNISPIELREMRYSDFVNFLKGFNASSDKKAKPPTEEEFNEILAKYEPEALT